MFKQFKRNFLAAAVSAFVLMLALPMAISAASLLSVSVDRSTLTPGQSVTFSIRTCADTNYVFAEVGANRVQAQRLGDQNWSLTVQPAATANIAVFANSTNNTSGAATFSIPVTVTGAAAATPAVPAVPGTAAPTGPLAIHSITETPATAQNQVQLTVVVGPEANEVWVRFDQERFRRGQEQTALRTATSRTFVIDFQPAQFVAQQVQVSANRQYAVAGATNQQFNVTLAAPFVRAANPTIQQVNVNPRSVTPDRNTTFTVRTNADVNYVWIVDVDGNRRNATRTNQQTATTRNWTVNFNPGRTGTVRVYANSIDSETGAATRNESITVQAATANMRNANAWWTHGWQGQQQGWGSVTVEVTTNYSVSRVWVELPNGNRPRLNQTSGSGTNDRVWRAEIPNVQQWNLGGSLQLRASLTDNYNTDASQTVSITGGNQGNFGGNATGHINGSSWLSAQSINASWSGNNQVSFNIWTQTPLSNLSTSNGWTQGGGTSWVVTIPWQNFHGGGMNFTLTATAQDGTVLEPTHGWINW